MNDENILMNKQLEVAHLVKYPELLHGYNNSVNMVLIHGMKIQTIVSGKNSMTDTCVWEILIYERIGIS